MKKGAVEPESAGGMHHTILLPMVRDSSRSLYSNRVGGAIAQGKTLEQIIKERPLADLDKIDGNAFLKPERFRRITYSDLSTPR